MKYIVTLNGMDYEVEVSESDAVVTNVAPAAAPVAPVAPAAPVAAAPAAPVAPAAAPAPAAVTTTGGTDVKAPMPGTILDVQASVGQDVKAGDVLFILEAMKMENEIVAPCDGKITAVQTTKGSTVATDAVLASIGGTVVAAAPAPVAAPAPAPAPVAAPAAPKATPANGEKVLSPFPGLIKELLVAEGAAVKKDQPVLVLEAMKMDNDITAPCDGTVSFCVDKGANVESDTVLCVIS